MKVLIVKTYTINITSKVLLEFSVVWIKVGFEKYRVKYFSEAIFVFLYGFLKECQNCK